MALSNPEYCDLINWTRLLPSILYPTYDGEAGPGSLQLMALFIRDSSLVHSNPDIQLAYVTRSHCRGRGCDTGLISATREWCSTPSFLALPCGLLALTFWKVFLIQKKIVPICNWRVFSSFYLLEFSGQEVSFHFDTNSLKLYEFSVANKTQWRKYSLFYKQWWDNWINICKRMKVNLFFTPKLTQNRSQT